jgi:putative transposase
LESKVILLKLTLTAKVKILPTSEQMQWLQQTLAAYRKACSFVSNIVFETKELSQRKLHLTTYRELRSTFYLRSQMAQSVMKTVIARYKSLQSNQHSWTNVQFKKPEYDLVWNRDYSLTKKGLSVNTLWGRIQLPFETKGMELYFDGSWTFGTSKLIYKHGKYYLHIPMTKEVEETSARDVNQVVGLDMGVNFIVTSYDSQGKSTFFHGRPIKDMRSKYKQLRKQLQQVGTASARRALKRIGQRENRFMTDVNHRVSKALVDRYGENTLFVVEDLTGIRQVTERVRVQDRYETVSWSFYQLRKMMEYKAIRYGAKVIAVDPRYTSQTCPKCLHIEEANRDKKQHRFKCKGCNYSSNDDRIGAMNLQRIGIEYIAEVAV